MTPSQRRPSSRARPSTRARPASDSSTERLTFLRLWVSEALRKTLISWKRSRRRNAFSSPFSLGIRTEIATPSGGSMRSSTSSPSASCGITSARTKLVASSRMTPVRASRSMSRTFSSVGTTSGSFWKPSRGPTSRMRTRSGVMAWRNLYSAAVSCPVVLLAGGTGGAKLPRGMLDEVGEQLVVIANTGDDLEAHGGYVSPDPDLVLYWLADRIDKRGWGLRDDSFRVMEALRELGEDVWFNLGDRDLAVCLQRARRLAAGATPTQAVDALRTALGAPARVLPPTDDPLRTFVAARGEWFGFQEFMIRERAQGPVEGVEVRGAAAARAPPQAGAALNGAKAIIIGPSNPVISIGPILAVPGIGDALASTPAPVVAVSPLVRGAVLKGPTDQFMAWAGHPLSSDGITAHYAGLLDGLVADERASDLPTLETNVEMADAAGRRRVAEAALEFALA